MINLLTGLAIVWVILGFFWVWEKLEEWTGMPWLAAIIIVHLMVITGWAVKAVVG